MKNRTNPSEIFTLAFGILYVADTPEDDSPAWGEIKNVWFNLQVNPINVVGFVSGLMVNQEIRASFILNYWVNFIHKTKLHLRNK